MKKKSTQAEYIARRGELLGGLSKVFRLEAEKLV